MGEDRAVSFWIWGKVKHLGTFEFSSTQNIFVAKANQAKFLWYPCGVL